MPDPTQANRAGAPASRRFDPAAAFLGYLIPGLGQLYQGRIGKGLLFLVCIYTLFFYGMALGSWKNVYLPDATALPRTQLRIRGIGTDLEEGPAKSVAYRLQFAGQFWVGVAAWPAIVQYNQVRLPFLDDFQKAPDETTQNNLQRDGDKTDDLGWVCTVIAGVLNILVMYDALAGPAFADAAAQAGHREPG